MSEVERVSFRDLAGFEPRQLEASTAARSSEYLLYGGTRGPGKSYWLRWFLLYSLIRLYKDYGVTDITAGLFCETYPILRDRQISKIQSEFPRWLGKLGSTEARGFGFYIRPEYGGGLLALRNLDKPGKYIGAEFALLGVDQIEQTTLETFNLLRGSKRWPGLPAHELKFLATANPGGIGHLWVKDYWIDRRYPPELQPIANKFAFVRGKPEDNPHLDAAYWEMLKTLPEDLARAWRMGDWNIFAGQVFREWSAARHVVEPFEIPSNWIRYRGVDWGERNPWCCLWLAQDPDNGRVIVYREEYETGLTDRRQARRILDVTGDGERIRATYADPSMWTERNMENKVFSTAKEYAAEGVYLTRADNNRIQGKRKVTEYLSNLRDKAPGLQVFRTCENLIRTLPALVHDKVNVEDVDTKGEDHAYDALRYALTSLKPPRPKDRERAEEPEVTVGKVKLGARRRGGLSGRDF